MGHPRQVNLTESCMPGASVLWRRNATNTKREGERGGGARHNGSPWARLGRLREGFLEEGSPEDWLGMSLAKRKGLNGPGGRAAGAKGLKPGDKVSPVRLENGRERGCRGGLGREGPGICTLSQGQWEVTEGYAAFEAF